jgi:hypothetical protein
MRRGNNPRFKREPHLKADLPASVVYYVVLYVVLCSRTSGALANPGSEPSEAGADCWYWCGNDWVARWWGETVFRTGSEGVCSL